VTVRSARTEATGVTGTASDTPAWKPTEPRVRPRIDIVVKVGGALLRDRAELEAVVGALGRIGPMLSHRTVLVIPGGGPFADAVRAVDAQFALRDDASHWMAILAMDQYAHLLAALTSRSALVDDPLMARTACAAGLIPILAPYRWLRAIDPLPHSWDVTSDSIAAWLALDAGASELILVKVAAGAPEALADSYFPGLIGKGAAAGQRLRVRSCLAAELFAAVGVAGNQKQGAGGGERGAGADT